MEDVLQSVVLYNNVKKAVFINKPFIYYRTNPQGITHGVTPAKLKKYMETIFFMWSVQDKIIVNWFSDEGVFKRIRAHRIRTILHKVAQMKRRGNKEDFINFCSFITEHDFVVKYISDFDNMDYGIYLKLMLYFFKMKKFNALWHIMEITERLYPTIKSGWKKIKR